MDHSHYRNLKSSLKRMQDDLDSHIARKEALMAECRASMERYLENLSPEDHDDVIDEFGPD